MSAFEIISLSAQVFTALGTVGAVVTSLWLVRKSQKISAYSTISYKPIFLISSLDIEYVQPTEEFVQITITNTGQKAFIVIGFVLHDNDTNTYYQLIPNYNLQLCTKTGHLLTESGTSRYLFDKDTFFESLYNNLQINDATKIIPRLKKIKFLALTNIEQDIKIRADNKFNEECVKAIQSLSVSSQTSKSK